MSAAGESIAAPGIGGRMVTDVPPFTRPDTWTRPPVSRVELAGHRPAQCGLSGKVSLISRLKGGTDPKIRLPLRVNWDATRRFSTSSSIFCAKHRSQCPITLGHLEKLPLPFDATKLPANNSPLFPVRFTGVHVSAGLDQQ
jgi:hypothetical protein